MGRSVSAIAKAFDCDPEYVAKVVKTFDAYDAKVISQTSIVIGTSPECSIISRTASPPCDQPRKRG